MGSSRQLVDLMSGGRAEFLHRTSRTLLGSTERQRTGTCLWSRGRLVAAVEASSGRAIVRQQPEQPRGEAVGSAGACGSLKRVVLAWCALARLPLSHRVARSREPLHRGTLPSDARVQRSLIAQRYEVHARGSFWAKCDAACLMLSDRKQWRSRQNYTEPNRNLGARQFITSLLGHVAPPVQ